MIIATTTAASVGWGYGAVTSAALTAIWWRRSSILGPKAARSDVQAPIDVYALAMLSGGPQLAITTAVTQLYQQRVLKAWSDGTLQAVGSPGSGAHALELELADTVRRERIVAQPPWGCDHKSGKSNAKALVAAPARPRAAGAGQGWNIARVPQIRPCQPPGV